MGGRTLPTGGLAAVQPRPHHQTEPGWVGVMAGGVALHPLDLGSLYNKTTADSDCSHEIKKRLLLGRKAMTNLDSVLKSRDITLPTKVHIVKAMVFPVVMYGCESWTIKKAECQRINAFKLCWRRLESPLDCKEIKPVNAKGNQLTIHWKDRC